MVTAIGEGGGLVRSGSFSSGFSGYNGWLVILNPLRRVNICQRVGIIRVEAENRLRIIADSIPVQGIHGFFRLV